MSDVVRLEYRNVTMRFVERSGKSLTAVEGVSLAVGDGEVVFGGAVDELEDAARQATLSGFEPRPFVAISLHRQIGNRLRRLARLT